MSSKISKKRKAVKKGFDAGKNVTAAKSSPAKVNRSERKRRKRILIPACICAVIFIVSAGLLLRKGNSGTGSGDGQEEADEASSSDPTATISVKDYGDIVVQLDKEAAPLTVENFVKLAREGFYDNLTFHRIIDGFMIQGGDPLGDGTGGSDQTIKGEFSSNGVENPISHKRGVISMARSGDPDSASSQFFIVQSDSLYLDGDYAAFGHVTEGMEIVDQICKDVPQGENGAVEPEDQPVIESITIS